jgi:hypothetical protein
MAKNVFVFKCNKTKSFPHKIGLNLRETFNDVARKYFNDWIKGG